MVSDARVRVCLHCPSSRMGHFLTISFVEALALLHKRGYLVYAIERNIYHSFDIVTACSQNATSAVSRPPSSNTRHCLSREARTQHLHPRKATRHDGFARQGPS